MIPLVSVVMPVYKSKGTLRQAVESVIFQTFKDFELIIVDDGCPESSLDAISDIHDSRIVVVKNSVNVGVATARNLAIEQAKGKYLAFLDSDDYWYPKKLEIQLSFLKNGIYVVTSGFDIVSGECVKGSFLPPEKIDYDMMLRRNFIGNLCGMYDARALGKVFQSKIGHEDYLMWLSILKKSGFAVSTGSVEGAYRISNGSLSSNKFLAAQWRWHIYRKELGLGRLRSLFYMMFYSFNAISFLFSKRISK